MSKQAEGATEKMGYKIGIAVSARVHRLDPIENALPVRSDNCVFSRKWRISDNRIETAVFSREYLRKFDPPMKRRERMRPLFQGCGHVGELVPRRTRRSGEGVLDLSTRLLPQLGLVFSKESRDHRVA